MRASALLCTLILLASGTMFAENASARQKLDLSTPRPLIITKDLRSKGTLVMEVNLGEVKVVRSEQEHSIRLTIEPGEPLDDATVQSWVRRFDVAGDRATIDLKLPRHTDDHSSPIVTISVPAQTDLKLELGVGELSIKGIEGNKELHVGIGDLTVGVTDRAKYSEIRTGTKIGDANDLVSSQHSSGFFPKTQHTSLQGLYRLHATVGIGDVNVVQD